MAGQTTKPYKNTFSGSVGAGMGSIFAPGRKKYYILEHKVSSKYHRAGECQEIIVDNITLGRDSHCQVRFDESFKTVSRRHAAIVREGDTWKLVQISQTNSTFLNGRPIKTEWYLQNGDEIQLSVNGPKLGFIIPTGKKSTVGSIGLTRRLSLFRQQALRPYKTAITVLSCVLVLAVGGLAGWNYMLREDFVKQGEILAQQIDANKNNRAKADSLARALVENNKKMGDYEERMKQMAQETSIAKQQAKEAHAAAREANKRAAAAQKSSEVTSTALKDQCFPYTYAIYQVKQVIRQPNGEVEEDDDVNVVGTGFLLSDGSFVTARHVVETWYYYHFNWGDERINNMLMMENAIVHNGGDIVVTFVAVSNSGDQIQFTNKQCRMDRNNDDVGTGTLKDGTKIALKKAVDATTDWAVVKTSKSGLPFDSQLSVNLPIGTSLQVLGFPYGRGGENPKAPSPISSHAEVAREGLDVNGTIMTSNDDTQSGNSGGPVLVLKEQRYTVVGILSGSTAGKGRVVPIKAIR